MLLHQQVLNRLAERIAAHVFAATKLHADDTPVPVLAPGAGKTRTGRLWVYARDDRASVSAPDEYWFSRTLRDADGTERGG